jgi:hypothetical protein
MARNAMSDLPSPPAGHIPPSEVSHDPGGVTKTTAAPAKTNTLAVLSLAIGIASPFGHVIPLIGGFGLALTAIITGYLAQHQIKERGELGKGMATVGMTIGVVHLLFLPMLITAMLYFYFFSNIFNSVRH